MAEKEVIFKLKAESEVDASLNDVKSEVVTAANDMSTSVAGVIPDEAVDSVKGFGSHTRMLTSVMRDFGGETGRAAAHVVSMGGHLVKMISRMNVWEIAIGAAVIGIGALVTAISSADGAAAWQEKWNKEVEEGRKKLAELADEVDRVNQTVSLQVQGIKDTEVTVSKARDVMETYKTQIRDVHKQMAQWRREHSGELASENAEFKRLKEQEIEYTRGWQSAAMSYTRAFVADVAAKNMKVKELEDTQNKTQEERDKKHHERQLADLRRKNDEELKILREGNEQDRLLGERQQVEDLRITREWQADEDKQAETAAKKVADREKERKRQELQAERLANREKQRIWKEEARALRELEKEREENIKQAIETASQAADVGFQIADMFDLFGKESAKTTEEKARAEAKAAAFSNGIKMATEIAESVAAFARGEPWAGTQHAIAATLYGAAMAKALGNMSGGGGGGGGGGASAGVAARSRFEEASAGNEESQEAKAKSNIVIYVYGHQVFGRDADRMFAESADAWRQSQNPGRDQRRF